LTSPADDLQRRLGPGVRQDEPLARHASSRVGGSADLFFVARTCDDLTRAVDLAEDLGVSWHIIGSASNLLVSDDGVEGLVIKATNNGTAVSTSDGGSSYVVEAEAGCIYASLARRMVARGLSGLEWAVNVPGTVGAAVVNNSGAFGSGTSEHLEHAVVHIPACGTRPYSPTELGLAYRTSCLKKGELRGVVLGATYRLEVANPADLRARVVSIQDTRRRSQPSGYSLGSVFANPAGDAAGRLIEAVGLKGTRVGAAEVSQLHANFILNRGGARASDVLALILQTRTAVQERFGISLSPEIQFLGRWTDTQLGGIATALGGHS
jgi:UDP-N-acetylmuramate dehydrogenase